MTEEQWTKIEKTLLPEMDRKYFRKKLDDIAADNSTPTQRRNECKDRLRWCRQILRQLPALKMEEDTSGFIAQVERQIQADEQALRVIAKTRSQISMRQNEILFLWRSRGGELPTSDTGPHVDFYKAAHEAVFQKNAPSSRHIKRLIKRARKLSWAVGEASGVSKALAIGEKIKQPGAPTP